MSKIKTYRQRIKGGKGKFKYFVGDKTFEDEKEARSYYDQLKGGGALGASKKIEKIDDQLKELKNRTRGGEISSFDAELKKKLLLQKGGAYHSAGIDTSGFSQPSGDLGQPVDSGDGMFSKIKKGIGNFFAQFPGDSEAALFNKRVASLTKELREMRDSGKPLPIDPRTGKPIPGNELNRYARFLANTELQEHKKNTDPLAIRDK